MSNFAFTNVSTKTGTLPEPGSLALLGLAGVGPLVAARRRRH